MIRYVEGDILLSGAEAIAHGVAPNDHFNQGLALSLRQRWPSMYKDFRHYSHSNHPKEGTIWAWKGAEGPVIYNLMTQEHAPDHKSNPGKAKTSYVNHCLRDLKKELQKNGQKKLALPKIATGVGGLDWDEVKPLIESSFSDEGIDVYVYETYKKDIKAKEA